MRLLEALLMRELAADEREARGLIMAGRVFVYGERRDKPSFEVSENEEIEVSPEKKYVSRGGLKLERALDAFGLDLDGKICLDIGSSTGGFTDCMLKNGARKVFSVDVGYGLLDWSLRNDPRVTVLERVNARALTVEQLNGMQCDFASVDVSFISLKRIFPALVRCMKDGAKAVALIKPQFEAERAQVGKGGIVRDSSVRGQVIQKAQGYARMEGLVPVRVVPSPIAGADGNIEFLMLLSKTIE